MINLQSLFNIHYINNETQTNQGAVPAGRQPVWTGRTGIIWRVSRGNRPIARGPIISSLRKL